MAEVDPFHLRMWLPELMSMHFGPLFMNNYFWTLDHLGVAQEEVLERDLELEVKNAI